MPEIVHPRLPDDRRNVDDDSLDRWLAAGWLPTETVDIPTDPALDPAPDIRRHSRRATKKEQDHGE